jgi:hypothetical protein
MCEDLKEEIAERDKAATVLIEHLEAMGATQLQLPIQTDDGCYLVKVIKTF